MLQQEKFLRALPHSANLRSCPIAYGFRILGKRWTIEIVRELLYGRTKFNELLRSIPGVSPRMLSLRLRELEVSRLVKKNVYSGTPVVIEYALTGSGLDVIPIMYAAAEFSMKNFPEALFEHGQKRTVEVREEIRPKAKKM
jgi:DNA-binding HxlR family transcriptional regulator